MIKKLAGNQIGPRQFELPPNSPDSDSHGQYVTVKRSTGLRFKSGAMILRTFTRVAGVIEVNDVTQDTVRAFLKGSGPITSVCKK